MSEEDKSDLKKLLYHVESDPSTGHIGMAEMQQIHTADIREIKATQKQIQDKHKTLYRFIAGVGGAVTFVVGKSWSNIIGYVKAVI